MSARRTLAAVVIALLSGCTVLAPSGLAGHPCGEHDACLAGYLCNAKGICAPAKDAGCKEQCGAGEKCVRQKCTPVCQGQACPPGQTCGTDGCEDVTQLNAVGSPCDADEECGGDLFCLKPYTGGIVMKGVCTKTCMSEPEDNCGNGTICTQFPQPDGQRFCANPGLTPCKSDAECASSGLLCSVMWARKGAETYSGSACGRIIDGGNAAGQACNPDGTNPCENGLCILQQYGFSGLDSYICSTPCAEDAHCTVLGSLVAKCTPITIAQPSAGMVASPPRVRTPLCINTTPKLKAACDDTTDCGADAPNCNPSPGICTPYCTDTTSDRCPMGTTCNTTSAICQ